MLRSASRLGFVGKVGICAGVLVLAPPARSATLGRDGVRVEFGPSVSQISAETVMQDEIVARDKVSGFLSLPAPALLTVKIVDEGWGAPHSDGDTIFAPERRVIWARVSQSGRPRDNLSLVHETTHVIDSGTRVDRFLTEGLAVYVQAKIGGDTYPNEGIDLHACARELQETYGKQVPITGSEAVRHAAPTGLGRQMAYAQEGSFARWLVETRGLAKFQRVLDSETPESVYGASFDRLDGDWRAMLARYPAHTAESCAAATARNFGK